MIVPMKKVSLIVLQNERKEALKGAGIIDTTEYEEN